MVDVAVWQARGDGALPSFFALASHGEADETVAVVPVQGKPK